jgi:hypothetical protein
MESDHAVITVWAARGGKKQDDVTDAANLQAQENQSLNQRSLKT